MNMEYFDIYDADGNATGVSVPRGTPLVKGQYYVGTHVYIHNAAGEFLLQRRAMDKDFLPGGWEVHLGHVIAGETSRECAVREVLEEVGLELIPDDLRFFLRYKWDEGTIQHYVDIYFIQVEYDLRQLVLQPSEVIDAKSLNAVEMLKFVDNMDYRTAEYRRAVKAKIIKMTEEKGWTR